MSAGLETAKGRQAGTSRRLSTPDRLRILALLVAVPIAAFIAWEASYASERWVPIMRQQPPREIAEWANYLEGRRIPFEIKGGGHDLWVPAVFSAELTIELGNRTSGGSLTR